MLWGSSLTSFGGIGVGHKENSIALCFNNTKITVKKIKIVLNCLCLGYSKTCIECRQKCNVLYGHVKDLKKCI